MGVGRVVSFPMYAGPNNAVERFWDGLRAHMHAVGLSDAPELLSVPDQLEAHWREPEVLLSQTCGYPFVAALAGKVKYVATPRYNAPGCRGACYSSVVLVRETERAATLADMRGRRAAFNSADSQSGYNGLLALVAPLAEAGRFFSATIETGAHRNSVAAIRAGRADLAAVDAVTWALLKRDRPNETESLRVLAQTALVPGLPLITSEATASDDLARLRAALQRAMADPALDGHRAALLIDGFEVLPPGAYRVIQDLRAGAVERGYASLN